MDGAGQTQGPYASASLYVGDLDPSVTEATLFELMNECGPVASVRVCRDAATRRSLGYAYVNFHRAEDAERALDIMNFKDIKNKPCRIMWSNRDRTLRESGEGNVVVKNLAKGIDNKVLFDTFSMFGNILSCKVATDAKGAPTGLGFVHFQEAEAAQKAIAQVDGKIIGGQCVAVARFRPRGERQEQGFTNLFVKHLPLAFDNARLQAAFQPHGSTTSCVVALDREGKSRGFGFVNFQSPEDAQRACAAMNGAQLEGQAQALYVARAQKREERELQLRDRFEVLKEERRRGLAGTNLYVRNLAAAVDELALRATFARCGHVTSAKVMAADGKSRGFGFVSYASRQDATRALDEMNGHLLEGQPLYVALAQRKEDRREQLANQRASQAAGFGGAGGEPIAMAPAMMVHPGHPGRSAMSPAMPPAVGYYGVARGFPFGQPPPQLVYGPPMGLQAMQPLPVRGPAYAATPLGPGPGPGPARTRAPLALPPRGVRVWPGPNQGRAGGFAAGPGAQLKAVPDHAERKEPDPLDPDMEAARAIKSLALAPGPLRKRLLGERLYPLVRALQPREAGQLTGMLLEMDDAELLHLMDSPAGLADKLQEAASVLQQHRASEQAVVVPRRP